MYAKNTWEKYANCVNDVMEYNEGYKDYISKIKQNVLVLRILFV